MQAMQLVDGGGAPLGDDQPQGKEGRAASDSPDEGSPEPEAPEDNAAEQDRREMADMLCHGTEIMVADEGHRLKNNHSFVSQSMNLIKTPRRIILTGYPLQNFMKEYAFCRGLAGLPAACPLRSSQHAWSHTCPFAMCLWQDIARTGLRNAWESCLDRGDSLTARNDPLQHVSILS